MIDVEALDRDSARVFAMTFDPLIPELGTVTNVDGDIVVPTDRFPFKLAQQLQDVPFDTGNLGTQDSAVQEYSHVFLNLGSGTELDTPGYSILILGRYLFLIR
jgi:hypothetical protein